MNNLSKINAWRASQGLEPLASSGKTERSRAKNNRTAANQASRAAFCQELKARRASNKGK